MKNALLTMEESKRLALLEREINKGKKSFIEVGLALAEIRDSRLYRSEFSTFQDYCKSKWGWDRQRAIQLINAAEVTQSLPGNVNNCLQTESQARELARVPESEREEVLTKAAASGKLTASSIRAASKPSARPAVEFDIPHIKTATEELDETRQAEDNSSSDYSSDLFIADIECAVDKALDLSSEEKRECINALQGQIARIKATLVIQ